MLNLAETKAVTKVMYQDWIPQIHIDQHQIGPTGARLWIPPFANPPNPNVHPLIWRGVALCGMNMAYDLQKNGFKGVQYGQEFAGWWDGACDNTPWFHNTICLLSEAAEVRVASPINIDPAEISKSYIEKSMQFPDPWPGGWWRLRDIVDYELTLSFSLVKTAFLHKEEFLYDFYRMCKDSLTDLMCRLCSKYKNIQTSNANILTVPSFHWPTTMRAGLFPYRWGSNVIESIIPSR